jgi:hypothetical protein
MKNPLTLLTAGTLLLGVACAQKTSYNSPAGYDFNHPVKLVVPAGLSEISGIAFNKGDAKTIFAEEDENGRVYYMRPGDKTARFTTFKETGDFEDMAIINGQVVMLQSKGVLFTFPVNTINKARPDQVQKAKDLLPKGEYEGLYGSERDSKVYVLCKNCDMDKTSKQCSGFIYDLSANGQLKQSGDFRISVKHIEDMLGQDKIRFHPSALSRSPLTGEWFILSSVNKILVVTDGNFKVRQVYKLNPDIFVQPEGMSFDVQNNLYISNEGQPLHPANILKFIFKKP